MTKQPGAIGGPRRQGGQPGGPSPHRWRCSLGCQVGSSLKRTTSAPSLLPSRAMGMTCFIQYNGLKAGPASADGIKSGQWPALGWTRPINLPRASLQSGLTGLCDEIFLLGLACSGCLGRLFLPGQLWCTSFDGASQRSLSCLVFHPFHWLSLP